MCMQYKNQSNDSPADESTPLISTTNADLHSIDIDDLSVSVQNAQIAEQDRTKLRIYFNLKGRIDARQMMLSIHLIRSEP
ncbi:hypothetical protein BATDEDRAFT_92984 [Batrachochytrium dendrobatidis JAM81]|uniref:Uncharacterized protein n=1 Tax=Batrachochytrium dendrobatidis (strain JAM81 / FGSC 10211) TaxID=684364 RepID=F4PF34_BATDJ|nr:uncharacterized protein BATDEDRAFT_92984 [Batrachochytrium dendrobatidis JAM81]EGF76158.1 hypothetical protein BATDEDRAFT_92984 [Batrachochytrium dendrobatidis JAM81]|eukprot:XP_006683216.1 hypothetical protein BATDEDRAFT_92984 [Batrachochytrium dendrobatidis JAM81]